MCAPAGNLEFRWSGGALAGLAKRRWSEGPIVDNALLRSGMDKPKFNLSWN